MADDRRPDKDVRGGDWADICIILGIGIGGYLAILKENNLYGAIGAVIGGALGWAVSYLIKRGRR